MLSASTCYCIDQGNSNSNTATAEGSVQRLEGIYLVAKRREEKGW